MTTIPKSVVPETDGRLWFDVTAIDPAFGVGKLLERIQASSREAAEQTAKDRHGKNVLVSLAGGRPRRRRAEPIDIGHAKGHR